MTTASISILNAGQVVTAEIYRKLYSIHQPVLAEIIGRLVAPILLPCNAAAEVLIHTLFIIPTVIYSIGKSIVNQSSDFTIPWQHLQRVRNAITPLLLSGIVGLIHPMAGVAICEPVDRHIFNGIKSFNNDREPDIPCSNLETLSMIEDFAKNHQRVRANGEWKEIFSDDHINALKGVRKSEKALQRIEAQELLLKYSNLTYHVLQKLALALMNTSYVTREILIRLSGILIPALAVIDFVAGLIMQSFMIVTGTVRMITGKGPAFTEITTDPLMHITFLVHNTLKLTASLIGFFPFLIRPMTGFGVSILPSFILFKTHTSGFEISLDSKIKSMIMGEVTAVPIAYTNNAVSPYDVPISSKVHSYMIIKKNSYTCDLHWVDKPGMGIINNATIDFTIEKILDMVVKRFPFFNPYFLLNRDNPLDPNTFYPDEIRIDTAGSNRDKSSAISNLFGMLKEIDRIKNIDTSITTLRRAYLQKELEKPYRLYNGSLSVFNNLYS